MDFLQGFIIITSIHLLAAASPGPDFVLVSQQTLSNGKKAGFLVSLGIALGLSIHIIYSALGLATVIANSVHWLTVIKVLGGSYLLYLGYCGIRAKAVLIPEEEANATLQVKVPSRSATKLIGMGFLCNALNPKAPIYFISLFTLVLSPDMPLYQLAAYGVWMMVLQMAWFSTVVGLLSSPLVNQKFRSMSHWIDRVFGGAMIIFGLKVLLSSIETLD